MNDKYKVEYTDPSVDPKKARIETTEVEADGHEDAKEEVRKLKGRDIKIISAAQLPKKNIAFNSFGGTRKTSRTSSSSE